MNKKIFIILLFVLFISGCSLNKPVEEMEISYEEKNKVYTLGEEKIIKEYVPEKPAYTEKVLSGKTTSWGLKSRYEVGKGKDILPGTYFINTKGWASYNIFIGGVEVKFDNVSNYTGYVYLNPLVKNVCYISETSCSSLDDYKKIGTLTLVEGDIIYTSYSPYSGQSVKIRFEAQYVNVYHEKVEAQPEIKVEPLEIKESVRKYSNGEYKCYINDYMVPNCDSLNYYEEILEQFN